MRSSNVRRLTHDVLERKLLNNEVKFRERFNSIQRFVYFVAHVEFFLVHVRRFKIVDVYYFVIFLKAFDKMRGN